MQTNYYDKINFPTGIVNVTDPCYEPGIWCAAGIRVKPGGYKVTAVTGNFGPWGYRVKELRICHEDYRIRDRWRFENRFAVDSGQAGIFDEAYYNSNRNKDGWYERVSAITLNMPEIGCIDELGCVSSSGLGDGMYECYSIKNKDGEIIALKLKFL